MYEWMNDPNLRDIDKNKIEFMMMLLKQTGNLKQTEMMPFLLAISAKAKKNNISFSQDEISAIVDVVKRNSGPQEMERINKILQITKLLG